MRVTVRFLRGVSVDKPPARYERGTEAEVVWSEKTLLMLKRMGAVEVVEQVSSGDEPSSGPKE